MACIFPGCTRNAPHNLGVRLRRPDTSAVWAPNTFAFLSDHHASSGVRITVTLQETDTGSVETNVAALPANATAANRVTLIVNAP